MGRPIPFAQEISDEICERIAEGQSLVSICRNENMPSYSTFMRWLEADTDLRDKYVRAREAMADADADRINDIGARVEAGELDPQAARVAIDALKWTAAKRQPKKYGDRLGIAGVDDSPLTVVVQRMTDAKD